MNKTTLRTDYTLHDQAYLNRKRSGHVGWDSADIIENSIRQMNSLLGMLDLPKRATVLDVGCGAGNLSFWLESKGFEVFGTDVSPSAIEWAKEEAEKRGTTVSFTVSDATESLPYPSECFDIVLDNHCLHCIIGVDRDKYLCNVFNVLKPGGVYIVSTMCRDPKYSVDIKGFDPESSTIIQDGISLRYLGSAESIIGELHAVGYGILHHHIYSDETGSDELVVIAKRGLSNHNRISG